MNERIVSYVIGARLRIAEATGPVLPSAASRYRSGITCLIRAIDPESLPGMPSYRIAANVNKAGQREKRGDERATSGGGGGGARIAGRDNYPAYTPAANITGDRPGFEGPSYFEYKSRYN